MRRTPIIVGTLLVASLLVLAACAPAAEEEVVTEEVAPAPSPAPAEFELVSLDSTPPEVIAGERVSITAVVENIGGSEGTYAVILTVNGVTVETKVVKVKPGKTETVLFTVAKHESGTHTVQVNDLSGTFYVLKPAQFSFSNLLITPSEAEVGQTVTVAVNVRNDGEVGGSYSATLMIDSVQVETKKVTVGAGLSQTVSFEFTKDTAGSYSIKVAGLTGLLKVITLTDALRELKVGYPELFDELLKLPELEEIDAKDDEAIEDIAQLALDAEYEKTFESMLDEGIRDERKYCTPLQALLWVAYDREFDGYNPLRNYSLTGLINDAWKNTDTSKSYTSERWQDFEEVVHMLNSPKLVAIYLQDNFTYSYEYGEPEGVKSAQQIFNEKKGACYDHALLAGYCLKENGYDETWGLKVRFERVLLFYGGHIVLVFQDPTDSLYYTIDNVGGSAVHGPFESIKEAAEYSVREQGLESYALGDINLVTTKYETSCDYWPVEYSSVTEPVLEEEEIELKYDDGVTMAYISVIPPIVTGYLVDFTPRHTPFTIRKVLMCGRLYGTGWEDKSFEVEIWDKDYNVLHSATYPVTKFSESPTWLEVEIPDIQVTDKFYVHVYTGTGIGEGIHMGADDSVTNEHSNVTIREGDTDKQLDSWPYLPSVWFGDKSKVNWMIRVVGTTEVSSD